MEQDGSPRRGDEVREGRRVDDLGAGVLDKGPFLEVVDRALADASDAERADLWVALLSFPSLPLLRATFPDDVVDDVLREVVSRMQATTPTPIAVARLRGDEVALASVGEYAHRRWGADSRGEKRFAAERIFVHGEPLLLSVRTGVAPWREGDDARGLLRRARVAHFAALGATSDDVRVHDDRLDQRLAEDAKLLGDLVAAIDQEELELAYQPKVELATGHMVGAEALVRWPAGHSRGLAPSRFVAAAERSGAIVPLGAWALRTACRQAARWREEGLEPFRVAVNVSPLQWFKTDLVRTVKANLQAAALPPGWLELEITERGAMAEGGEVERVATALRELGVTIALDDFGTGRSSLMRLVRIPIQRLKIDQGFVKRCPPPDGGRCLLRAIVTLGHNLDLQVLAEGVETVEQATYLRSVGCDEGQGFYYAPALEPDALADYARAHGGITP